MSNHPLDRTAEAYVRLVLALGQHDADYVDAYYGPPEWRTAAEAEKAPLDEIGRRGEALRAELEAVDTEGGEWALRHRYQRRQLEALLARLRMLRGEKLRFDEESQALYDAVAPHHDAAHFQAAIDELDAIVPGKGPLVERWEAYKRGFVVPPDRVDQVFRAAIAACRERTARHLALPAGENFRVEYVTGKSWSGYNWYQGSYASLIQVNVELPIYIERAVDLACHEGYPGHHVYNALLEEKLVRGRGWIEFTVYPLFSPQSLIAEGTANFGIQVAFPGDERLAFERDVLYPLAGLDPAKAANYDRARQIVAKLSYAGNEAARRYLDGEFDAEQAVDWQRRYGLYPEERARQRIRFFDQYRSYVINYNLGEDMVRQYVEARGGSEDRPAERWRIFADLLASPRLPADLRAPASPAGP